MKKLLRVTLANALFMAALVSAFSLQAFSPSGFSATPVYLDDSQPIEARVNDALSRMTLEEKIAMVHAQSKFSSPGVPRLGIPENWMSDGPHGIRPEVFWDKWDQAGWSNDSCTAFPALTCLAATWNPDMAALYGKSIGEEARYRNKNVLLGPGVNIYRTPLNGRNFEYMGEDPCLASRIVARYVQGVQSNGVATCVKHYALNNQEVGRHVVDVHLDDRALYEIYLPAFRAAVQEGRTWAIMGSYNLYNGEHATHNATLINKILRDEWHFDGVVVSDWGAVHDTKQAINTSLDIEFATNTQNLKPQYPGGEYNNYHLAQRYLDLIKTGEVPLATLDAKVRNILRLSFRTTMNRNRPSGSFATPAHYAAARRIAEEGIDLLKNDNNVLPIDLAKTKKILVVGENAFRMMTIGGGSSQLKAAHEISPIDGLRARLADTGAKITYVRGYTAGDKKTKQDGIVSTQKLEEKRPATELIAEATAAARDADIVIYIGGLNKNIGQDCEDADRADLGLPYGQDALISALADANKNLAVVLISGNAVAMPWVDKVPAIVQAWYLGSEAGPAIAAVLTGDDNPSGKLPFSFPARLEDNGAIATNSYVKEGIEEYKEGIYVGYRWLEKHDIKPLFAFGHGLSYTTFAYGQPTLDKPTLARGAATYAPGEQGGGSPAAGADALTLTIPVKNTGARPGAEVVQLYIRELNPAVDRPVKELKAFAKITLAPGEEKPVTFAITPDKLQYFDAAAHKWTSTPGKFEAQVGSASDDIRAKIQFDLLK